jgi:hypothetical protein
MARACAGVLFSKLAVCLEGAGSAAIGAACRAVYATAVGEVRSELFEIGNAWAVVGGVVEAGSSTRAYNAGHC